MDGPFSDDTYNFLFRQTRSIRTPGESSSTSFRAKNSCREVISSLHKHADPRIVAFVPIFTILLAKKESDLEIPAVGREIVAPAISYRHIKWHPRIWDRIAVGQKTTQVKKSEAKRDDLKTKLDNIEKTFDNAKAALKKMTGDVVSSSYIPPYDQKYIYAKFRTSNKDELKRRKQQEKTIAKGPDGGTSAKKFI